ncbi:MAG TPA: glucose-1-phosphate adenylyltransferase [Gammaproteobacteria bacterium]|nr:glucose-1-phosphate adenylyltransferase [Gammaproteobacteria bacterium]
MLDQTLTLILAGGAGTRLSPLTAERAKPAVPFGGKYRIVDFTLTNCLHSGLRRVLVLTQYKSHSLQKHLRDGWSIYNSELSEYITPVPPQMRTGDNWYAGTADAVFQNLYLLQRSGARLALVLSGDHIYRMDYAALLDFHRENRAEATVACMPVPLDQADQFGVVTMEQDGRISRFEEKPEAALPLADDPDHALASMGVYLFDMELLINALGEDHHREQSSRDFGRDILPRLAGGHRVLAYRFGEARGRVTPDRYWRDVGTLDSFYRANMDLLKPVPPLDLYQQDWPIRTYQGQTPPARTVPGESGDEGIFINSIIAGGTVIAGGRVQHSILFPEVYVGDEATVEESLLFDGVQVGDRAQIRRCIVDKNVHIPAGERIGYEPARDRERFGVSAEGIVVVPKGYRVE